MSAQLNLFTGEGMIAALFRGGPIDGKRYQVPAREQDYSEAKPAFVRWHSKGRVWWYVWRKGTKATYELLMEPE